MAINDKAETEREHARDPREFASLGCLACQDDIDRRDLDEPCGHEYEVISCDGRHDELRCRLCGHEDADVCDSYDDSPPEGVM